MNIKSIITKIFSLTLIFGVMFFGMSSVFAGCPEFPNICSIPSNYDFECRGNPTDECWAGGCIRDDANEWFNNNAVSDDGVMTSDEINNYNTFVGYYGGGVGGPSAVRFLQETINSVRTTPEFSNSDCGPVCEDGRFGNDTIENLSNCIPCLENEELRPLWDGVNFGCNSGDPNENGCCPEQEDLFCNTTISGPTTYAEGSDVEVTVLFESDAENPYEDKPFVVIGGDLSSEICVDMLDGIMECSLVISPNSDSIEVTIESPEGAVKYNNGDVSCPDKELTVMWDEVFVDCENNDEEKPLTGNNNDCFDYGPGRTSNSICCEKCDKAPNTSSGENCEQTYGSGRDLGDGGCCEFECPKKTQTPPAGEKLDEESCERVCDPNTACCGIQLNTVVPFIGDCIEMTTQNSTAGANGNTSYVNQLNAFPFLMMGLSKILVTVILIFSFMVVIIAGLMMVTGVFDGKMDNYEGGVSAIKKIIVALILLGSSGLILKLINPTFFGG